ncbi:MAG: MBL fold metallo-hydrolase [Chlamydia sp.]
MHSQTQTLFCPLASGSKGNSIYVETASCRLLFDAGISLKTLQARLAALNRSISDIDAIVISHEHHDHISGIKAIASRYDIPLIANHATAEAIVTSIGFCPKFHIFTTGEPFEWKQAIITPFSIQHDSIEPAAFTLQECTTKISICTDLGFVTTSVRRHLKESNILYIEANHQPEMVHASSRPNTYKNRVLGKLGHLSNESSAQLIGDIADSSLHQIYLAHLSSECNNEKTAYEVVHEVLSKQGISIPIAIAYQNKISLPFHINRKL